MAAAVYWWHTFRYDVCCVNPPLTRIVAGVPVVLCRPNYDWSSYSSRPQDRCEGTIGRAFIAANSLEQLRWCFALARWSLLPLVLVGGYFGCRLSEEMYGSAARVVFLVLWCCSPSLLAWGATICPDAAAASLGIVAVYSLRRWLRRPDWARAATAGVCLGLLPLAKLTWIIAMGLWPLLWCFWTAPRCLKPITGDSGSMPTLRQLAVVLFAGLYTLNMGYLFDGTFRPLGRYEFVSQLFGGQEPARDQRTPVVGNRFAGTWLGAVPVPLPADFLQGIDIQRYDFERGLPSCLRGEWADHGWWYYYLYALAIKEPLGTWCLAALAAGMTVGSKWSGGSGQGLEKRPSPPTPLPEGEGTCTPSPLATLPKGEGTCTPSPPATLPREQGSGFPCLRIMCRVLTCSDSTSSAAYLHIFAASGRIMVGGGITCML